MDSVRHLTSVTPSAPPDPTPAIGEGEDVGRDDYWARVQRLRDELARLRPAN